jgi:hypothetical protein
MATGINRLLRVGLAGSAIGGLIAFAPPAAAQWAPPPWRSAWPGEIERDLEAQGYVLTAPLMRRPGIYLADVSTGPGGYQRLIIDARSGQVLESFPGSSRFRESVLADRDEEFGESPPGVGRPLSAGSSAASVAVPPPAKSNYGRPASVRIPAAITPYGPAAAPVGARARTKVASTERKIPGAKAAATVNPPLPPPAKRLKGTNRACLGRGRGRSGFRSAARRFPPT